MSRADDAELEGRRPPARRAMTPAIENEPVREFYAARANRQAA
jgi:hypothetical protein